MLIRNLLTFSKSRLGCGNFNQLLIRSLLVKTMSDISQDKNCIFCKIVRDEEPSQKIYQDDDVICFKDISPASTHHYLIIPKKHIPNAKCLKAEDEELYDKIVDKVRTICDQQNLNMASTRTGFHWPPFTRVSHLHLHVISPIENMSFVHKMMFKPDSYWFVSTDYVKSRFKNTES